MSSEQSNPCAKERIEIAKRAEQSLYYADRPNEHTRKDNKNIIRRACEEAVVQSMLNACCEHATIITEQHLEIESMHRQLEHAEIKSSDFAELLFKEQKKLQQAEADKERLDWLLRDCRVFVHGMRELEIHTREAIDEARKK